MSILSNFWGSFVSRWDKNQLFRVSLYGGKSFVNTSSNWSERSGFPCAHIYANKLCSQPLDRRMSGVVNEENSSLKCGETTQKLVKVAVVGTPNAGKSTFINQIVGRRVCSISSKVHTTRNSVRAIMNEGNSQVIFLDTPGLISASESKRHNLEKSFFVDAELSMAESDLIVVIHDVSNKWTRDRLDIKVTRLLHFYCKKTAVLVMNKVDSLRSKRKLLDLTHGLTLGSLVSKSSDMMAAGNSSFPHMSATPLQLNSTDRNASEHSGAGGWPCFENIFMISALKGEGIDAVKDYIFSKARVRPWQYPSSVFTDQKLEDLIILAVREKLLECLPQEIPYNIETELEYANISPTGNVVAVVLVKCAFLRHAKMLLSARGSKIRSIAKAAEEALESTFMENVHLNLVVQTKK
ncbi:GTPase Era, mitochondrial [Ischnura elegans]|uniref:GTPase Era, mitochondrial n=1 Tax=Ischnura elegans TaxID=197161 RepID=UPI001ED8A3BE|nr:GTPase Era, mitochondrial [Ischnura elegans]XP_046386870.1 GTPase Era, mitochondrial [Ischnura elegans]XP_046386878.1 GTPase Era, mitochondrial [Ischnura elegans]XP_046386888.1 GTPase Era, mitochondrial [Ischnura elegans]